jgi:glycosyltransferase involved in cell wall biosynthesis
VDVTDVFLFHEFIPMPRGFFDIPKLRSMGKCVILATHGTEYRPIQKFLSKDKFAQNDNVDDLLRMGVGVVDEKALLRLQYAQATANGIVTYDNEMAAYFDYDAVVGRALDLNEFPVVGIDKTRRGKDIVVVHAPSNLEVKGTVWVRQAVEELRSEGLEFDYRELHGVPQSEVMREVRNADIVIDQFRTGWYGVFATEAMAYGKPVLVYVREDVQEKGRDVPPMMYVTRHGIRDGLRKLLNDSELRASMSVAAREHVERNHNSETEADRLISTFEDLCYRRVRPINEDMRQKLEAIPFLQQIAAYHY